MPYLRPKGSGRSLEGAVYRLLHITPPLKLIGFTSAFRLVNRWLEETPLLTGLLLTGPFIAVSLIYLKRLIAFHVLRFGKLFSG
jgi:hypothetical protein